MMMTVKDIDNLVRAAEHHQHRYCHDRLMELINEAETVLPSDDSAIVRDYRHTVALLSHPNDQRLMRPSDRICRSMDGDNYVYTYVINEARQIGQMVYGK